MARFILRRFLSGVLTVLMVFVINFIIIKAAPGDPIRTIRLWEKKPMILYSERR